MKYLSFLFLLSACQTPTRSQIDGLTYLNNLPLPEALCASNPEIKHYGFYRRLNDGRLEFWSICNQLTPDMIAMKGDDYRALLDQYIKPSHSTNTTLDPQTHQERGPLPSE